MFAVIMRSPSHSLQPEHDMSCQSRTAAWLSRPFNFPCNIVDMAGTNSQDRAGSLQYRVLYIQETTAHTTRAVQQQLPCLTCISCDTVRLVMASFVRAHNTQQKPRS
jgi:hypothetical protein